MTKGDIPFWNISQKKKKLLTIIIIIIIIATGLIFLYEPKPEGLTALEALELADEVALEFNENATLKYLRGLECDRGYSNKHWEFTYCGQNGTNESFQIDIAVHGNGTVYSRYKLFINSHPELPDPDKINNISLDSNEAFEIALNDSQSRKYVKGSTSEMRYIDNTWSITVYEHHKIALWLDSTGAQININEDGIVTVESIEVGMSSEMDLICYAVWIPLGTIILITAIIILKKLLNSDNK